MAKITQTAEMHSENLLRSLHILTMMYYLERTGTTRILMSRHEASLR